MKAAVKCTLLLNVDDSALLAISNDVSETEEILKRELESLSEWSSENCLLLSTVVSGMYNYYSISIYLSDCHSDYCQPWRCNINMMRSTAAYFVGHDARL